VGFSKRHLLSAALLGIAGVLLAVAVSAAEGPTIEAAGGVYGGYYWSPSSSEVGTGGTVTFKNTSGLVEHGVVWDNGPETPSCTGVPINEGKTNWHGSCTFTKPGTYQFHCYVHPTEMKGTITVSPNGTITTNPPPPVEAPGSPLNGPASKALDISKKQRGPSVRGSIELSQAGAGSKLRVELRVRGASLFGAGHKGTVGVGQLVRSSLQAGRVSFTVSLNGLGRRALRRHMRLPLSVTVIVIPLKQGALKLRRGLILHV
jgi:plastocyanin